MADNNSPWLPITSNPAPSDQFNRLRIGVPRDFDDSSDQLFYKYTPWTDYMSKDPAHNLPSFPPSFKDNSSLVPNIFTPTPIEPPKDDLTLIQKVIREDAVKAVNVGTGDSRPNFASGEYKFPHDVGQRHIPDFMSFYFLDLMRPDGSWVNDDWTDATSKVYIDASKAQASSQGGLMAGNINLVNTLPNKVTEFATEKVIEPIAKLITTDEKAAQLGADIRSSVQNFAGRSDTYKLTGDVVRIMMPASVEFNDGAGWQAVNATPTGLGLLANVALTEATLGDVGGYEINKMISSVLYEDGAGAASATVKKVLNPFVSQAFESMGRRQFRFNWIVTPKNENELATVKAIIQLFRYHMHPHMDVNKAFLRYPSQVDIKFMVTDVSGQVSENSWLPKVTTCVIKDFSTNYTPNGQWATSNSQQGGAPYQFQFSVSLEEIVPLVKQDILGGY